MRNISFVLWMVFFPLAETLESYLSFLMRGPRSFTADTIGVDFLVFAFYIGIGMLLYEEKSRA